MIKSFETMRRIVLETFQESSSSQARCCEETLQRCPALRDEVKTAWRKPRTKRHFSRITQHATIRVQPLLGLHRCRQAKWLCA